jgi:hypothetical protein
MGQNLRTAPQQQFLRTAPQQQFLISAVAQFAIKDRIIARKGEDANAIPN